MTPPVEPTVTTTDDIRDRETPVAPATTSTPTPITDPSPRFGASFISLVIWVAFAASIVALALGLSRPGGGIAPFLACAICAGLAGALHTAVFSKNRIVVTVRKASIRLPVLRDPDVQRVGALAGVAATTCARCSSFDLAVGQHALDQHGDFRMASRFLRPGQMMKTRGAWDASRGFDDRGQPVDQSGGPAWDQLGGCGKTGKLVFAPHSCKDWS